MRKPEWIATRRLPATKPRRDAAIDWLSRIKAGTMTRSDRDAFDAWLEADEANRAAFEKAFALWRDLKGVLIPAAAVPSRRPATDVWRRSRSSRRVVPRSTSGRDLAILWRADFSTGVGELKTVTLEDGSRIELNADTAIAKHYSGGRRRLTLLKGEAWFTVACDPLRPFVVEAAGGTMTALGTSFDIAMKRRRQRRSRSPSTRSRVAARGRDGDRRGRAAIVLSARIVVRLPRIRPMSTTTAAWRRGISHLPRQAARRGHRSHQPLFSRLPPHRDPADPRPEDQRPVPRRAIRWSPFARSSYRSALRASIRRKLPRASRGLSHARATVRAAT